MRIKETHKKNVQMKAGAAVENFGEAAFNIAAAANQEFDDIVSLLKIIHKELDRVIDASSFYISLLDKASGTLSFPYVVDEALPQKTKFRSRKFGNGITEYLYHTGKSLLADAAKINELAAQKKIKVIGPMPKLWLGIPLKIKGETMGTLTVQSYKNAFAFDKDTQQLLEFVSGQISNAISRQQASDAIHQSEQYFRTLTENSSDVITILNARGGVIYESSSLTRVFGYEKETLLETPIEELVYPSDIYKVARAFTSVIENPKELITIEFRFKHQNGDWRFVESVFSNFLNDPAIKGIVVNSRDISDRKTAENSLELSKDILERIGTLVIVANSLGEVTYVGSSSKRILGYDPKQLMGDGWWQLTYENHLLGEKKRLRTIAYAKGETPMTVVPYERKVKCRNGDEIWILWQDTRGPGDLIIGVGHDITKQKMAMKASLESEEKLRLKNIELDTFVYKASHDLKGPLASILGLINVMRQEARDPASLQYTELIKESTIRLDSILMDLLQVTRLKQGKVEYSPIAFDKLIHEVSSSLKGYKDFNIINLRVYIDDGLDFMSDKKLLISVMQNLIDNAIKYRNMEVKYPFIYVSVVGTPEGVKIRILDNGQGIPTEIQEKVFDMFFRGHEKSQGTGLGLYIVKNTVEKMGGEIFMESELGKGTHFTIYLPNKSEVKTAEMQQSKTIA